MRVKVYAGAELEYYQRLPGAGVLRWRLDEDSWIGVAAELPDGATEVALSDLPPALQEELLATATRTQAIGSQLWGARN